MSEVETASIHEPMVDESLIKVTDLEPPEFSAREARPVSERYRSDLAELFATPSEPRREREGLPSTYRTSRPCRRWSRQ